MDDGGPQCSEADYHGDSMANLKLTVCDVTNTATERYTASYELDYYLREGTSTALRGYGTSRSPAPPNAIWARRPIRIH